MFRSLALVALLAATSASGLAATPSPEPPLELKPGMELVLSDGSVAHVSPDGHHLTELKDGKVVQLPPGPCKLKNGMTVTIGPDGKPGRFADVPIRIVAPSRPAPQ